MTEPLNDPNYPAANDSGEQEHVALSPRLACRCGFQATTTNELSAHFGRMADGRIEPLDDSDPSPMTDEEWEPFAAATGIEPLFNTGMDHPNDDSDLADDLADVLSRVVVGWEDRLGVDLAQHPDVVRVMARYREARSRA